MIRCIIGHMCMFFKFDPVSRQPKSPAAGAGKKHFPSCEGHPKQALLGQIPIHFFLFIHCKAVSQGKQTEMIKEELQEDLYLPPLAWGEEV